MVTIKGANEDICDTPELPADTPVPDNTDADILRLPILGSVCIGTPPIVVPIVLLPSVCAVLPKAPGPSVCGPP